MRASGLSKGSLTFLKTYLEYKKRGVDTLKAHEKEISKLVEDEPKKIEEEQE